MATSMSFNNDKNNSPTTGMEATDEGTSKGGVEKQHDDCASEITVKISTLDIQAVDEGACGGGEEEHDDCASGISRTGPAPDIQAADEGACGGGVEGHEEGASAMSASAPEKKTDIFSSNVWLYMLNRPKNSPDREQLRIEFPGLAKVFDLLNLVYEPLDELCRADVLEDVRRYLDEVIDELNDAKEFTESQIIGWFKLTAKCEQLVLLAESSGVTHELEYKMQDLSQCSHNPQRYKLCNLSTSCDFVFRSVFMSLCTPKVLQCAITTYLKFAGAERLKAMEERCTKIRNKLFTHANAEETANSQDKEERPSGPPRVPYKKYLASLGLSNIHKYLYTCVKTRESLINVLHIMTSPDDEIRQICVKFMMMYAFTRLWNILLRVDYDLLIEACEVEKRFGEALVKSLKMDKSAEASKLKKALMIRGDPFKDMLLKK